MAFDASNPKGRKELLRHIRGRYRQMHDADQENRRLAMEDLRFVTVPGAQWDDNMKRERGNRPCYEFNKLRITAKRIINEMRANRAQGKVRGVEDGDKDTAEIYEGLIRNIWNASDGDSVIDHAAEYQVNAGYGAWRITTKYSHDTAFEQDIVIEPIENPFCLYADPSCKDELGRDAEDWMLVESMAKSAYKERWPKAEVVNFEADEFDDQDEWMEDEEVRVCEYWWREPEDREFWLLVDGKVIDSTDEAAAQIPQEAIVRRRDVRCYRIMTCIASGDAILEGPSEWAGPDFPFVRVYGERVVVEGRKLWHGIVRWAKDAQRSYNVSRTAVTETIAMAPKSKWWATVDQAKGHTGKWAEADKKNYPFMLYNADPKAPGAPARMAGPDVPVALMQELQLASEEIKAVTGIYDASLGNKSNEQSGRAIMARQQQGEIATFNYQDNMAKGIRRTWEILVNLIPKVYDTERKLRILGSDGAEDYVRINQIVQDPETGKMMTVHDLASGRFDVTITVGPSFSTRRVEASEMYLQLAQANPAIFPIAGDLIFKSMDLPYAEDISERLKVMLPPQIQQMLQEGENVPPEVQAMMAQAQQAMMQVQQQMQQVQQAAQELQAEQANVDKGKSEIEKRIADLKTEEARFEARVAKEMARITTSQAQLDVKAVNQQGEVDQAVMQSGIAAIGEQVAQAISAIQQTSEQFAQQAVSVLAEIQQARIERPRIKEMVAERKNGKLVARPVYEEA